MSGDSLRKLSGPKRKSCGPRDIDLTSDLKSGRTVGAGVRGVKSRTAACFLEGGIFKHEIMTFWDEGILLDRGCHTRRGDEFIFRVVINNWLVVGRQTERVRSGVNLDSPLRCVLNKRVLVLCKD